MLLTSSSVFPTEVVLECFVHCSEPELCSLAVLDKAFGYEAERLLYSDLVLDRRWSRTTACLETLLSNSTKSTLVRSLLVSFGSAKRFLPEGIIESCCSVLKGLNNVARLLLDIPTIYDWSESYAPSIVPTPYASMFSRALQGSTFSLTHATMSREIDLERWILHHPSLQTLQILLDSESAGPSHDELQIYRRVQNGNLIVFSVTECLSVYTVSIPLDVLSKVVPPAVMRGRGIEFYFDKLDSVGVERVFGFLEAVWPSVTEIKLLANYCDVETLNLVQQRLKNSRLHEPLPCVAVQTESI
ncbi:hypothetical protein C8J56DRAFT_1053633 [Mycena floridula]|nr:hypothetical protein C8J56DRAFT_1053633 [Mycena floridula]